MGNENELSFDDIKSRLDEIVEAVNADDISLDEALDLYEEAVNLGMRASELIEEGEEEKEEEEAFGEEAEADADAPGEASESGDFSAQGEA